METSDDAGVYRISPDTALVQTVDFFTPVVDDPFVFGQAAAVNSLSDVYAMGGKPLTALNLVCFPKDKMDGSVLEGILKGGADKMKEAGVVLVGGHSVVDPELKYGLAVTGIVHPEKVVRNVGAKSGDVLILTKPLGVGILTTAVKFKKISNEGLEQVCKVMLELNRAASEAMMEVGVHACTDITGFGLLGHLSEMARGSGVTVEIQASSVPVLEEARKLIKKKIFPGGLTKNKNFYGQYVTVSKDVPPDLLEILYDPQTSGGLLIAVPEEKSRLLLSLLHERGLKISSVIGKVVGTSSGEIGIVQ